MGLYGYEKVSVNEVDDWLRKSKLKLTPQQIRDLSNYEIARFAPFDFYKRCKPVKSIWIRLSAIFLLPTLILLLIGLPLNYLITGIWGYSDKFGWYGKWARACGF
jgi:hypothetical protein